jgi:hypothetical protein
MNRLCLIIITVLAVALGVSLCTNANAAKPPGTCDWNNVGAAPYMGTMVSCVDSYTDISAVDRAKLKQMIGDRAYTDDVMISRDKIEGMYSYDPQMWDMHWQGGVCKGMVDRSKWPAEKRERAYVYTTGNVSVIIPFACRNCARTIRGEPIVAIVPVIPLTPNEMIAEPMPVGPIDAFDGRVMPLASTDSLIESTPVAFADTAGGFVGAPVFGGFYGGGGGLIGRPPVQQITPPGTISPVPEPSTWLSMLLGFGLMGYVIHRRRS